MCVLWAQVHEEPPGKYWRPALLLSILFFWDRVFHWTPCQQSLCLCPISVLGLQIWAAMPHFLSGVRGFEHSMHLYSWAVSLDSSYIFFKQIIGKTLVKDFLVEGFEIRPWYLDCWPGTCYVALAGFNLVVLCFRFLSAGITCVCTIPSYFVLQLTCPLTLFVYYWFIFETM